MASKTEMEQIEARLTKLEDFKSDQEALTRIRLKGFQGLLARGRAIDTGDKRFWTMKQDAVDLVYSCLEPVLKSKWGDLAPEALAEKLTKVLNEMSSCLLEGALVGFFPVGSPWATADTVDLRMRPGILALRMNNLVNSVLAPATKGGDVTIWVPLGAGDMRRKRRRQGLDSVEAKAAAKPKRSHPRHDRDRRSRRN